MCALTKRYKLEFCKTLFKVSFQLHSSVGWTEVQLVSNFYAVRFEVHMAVTMKICVFLGATPSSVIVIYQLVGK